MLFLVSATLLAAPLAGQDERTRVDDFSISADSPPSLGEVEQIRAGQVPIEADEQVHDRQVEVAQQGTGDPAQRVAQLSAGRTASAPDQLSTAGNPTVLVAVEGRAQSRPQPVQRLTGTDRCDPQLERAKLAECLGILERRADQFTAPAPPQLSAEERLLAERQRDERAAGLNGDMRVRFAGLATPDADLQSNQELAALVLEGPAQPPPATPASEPELEGLAEALQGLSIDVVQGQLSQ